MSDLQQIGHVYRHIYPISCPICSTIGYSFTIFGFSRANKQAQEYNLTETYMMTSDSKLPKEELRIKIVHNGQGFYAPLVPIAVATLQDMVDDLDDYIESSLGAVTKVLKNVPEGHNFYK